jgi:hypothetical protein
MDLFVVPTIGFKLLYAFVIVRLNRRDLVWINVTTNPTSEWVARQITEAFPWNEAPRYMIRDRPAVPVEDGIAAGRSRFFGGACGQVRWNCFGHSELNDGQRAFEEAAMHLQTYREESRSRHFDLIGGHRWSIDLVAATASCILMVGFACAVVALWIH